MPEAHVSHAMCGSQYFLRNGSYGLSEPENEGAGGEESGSQPCRWNGHQSEGQSVVSGIRITDGKITSAF